MFAVMKAGGKQYRVTSGDVLRVEKLAAAAGDKVQFNEILMLGGDDPVVGSPLVEGAAVQAEVLDQIKDRKVIHFVKRRRKHGSKRTRGHRQQLTLLRVTEILAKGADKSGVKAAIGAGSAEGRALLKSTASFADNRAEQAEMKKRVKTGEAPAKPAEKASPAKAEPKADKPAKAEAKPAKAEKPAKATKPAAEEAEASGTRPANLLDAPKGGKADDLKKISGVGPKIEKLLHENGVYHYDQIAAWSEEEIAYMDDKLSFKGRIARDDWVEQAGKLAAEKE